MKRTERWRHDCLPCSLINTSTAGFADVVFHKNEGHYGGAITMQQSTLRATNANFTENQADGPPDAARQGGAIWAKGSMLSLQGCRLDRNYASSCAPLPTNSLRLHSAIPPLASVHLISCSCIHPRLSGCTWLAGRPAAYHPVIVSTGVHIVAHGGLNSNSNCRMTNQSAW